MRADRRRAMPLWVIVALLAPAPAAPAQQPQTRTWNNPAGGTFADPANWADGVPVANDLALFDYSGRSPYTVLFDNGATFGRAVVGDEDVTFVLGGHEVRATGKAPGATNSFEFGTAAGQRASVHIGGGTLIGFGNAVLAGAADSAADVTLSGPASRWDGLFVVGRAGTARLEVSGGAQLNAPTNNSRSVIVGEMPTGRGELVVTGPGSRLSAGPVFVGGYLSSSVGHGTVSVLDGASVAQAGSFWVGPTAGGTGRVVVSGVGVNQRRSTLQSSDFVVGVNGNASLAVQNGARLNTNGLRIALGNGSVGDVVVGGEAGGFRAEVIATHVGIATHTGGGLPYTGAVTVNAGGVVDSVNNVILGSERAGTGTLNVNGGEVRTFTVILNRGEVNLNEGSITARVQRIGSLHDAQPVFAQRGGTNRGGGTAAAPVAADMFIGSNTSRGSYHLHGGTLVAKVLNSERGTFNHTGGTFSGEMSNYGTYAVTAPPAGEAAAGTPTFTGPFFNNPGAVRVTGAAARFDTTFNNYGSFFSDGGQTHFTKFITANDGSVEAVGGSEVTVSRELWVAISDPTRWDTTGARLKFDDAVANFATTYIMTVDGADRGVTADGFRDNFAWGAVRVAANDTLDLRPDAAGRALYVGELIVEGGAAQLSRFRSSEFATTIYYDERLPANDYLGGRSYQGVGVRIEPVPEPAASLLLLPAMWAMTRRPRIT